MPKKGKGILSFLTGEKNEDVESTLTELTEWYSTLKRIKGEPFFEIVEEKAREAGPKPGTFKFTLKCIKMVWKQAEEVYRNSRGYNAEKRDMENNRVGKIMAVMVENAPKILLGPAGDVIALGAKVHDILGYTNKDISKADYPNIGALLREPREFKEYFCGFKGGNENADSGEFDFIKMNKDFAHLGTRLQKEEKGMVAMTLYRKAYCSPERFNACKYIPIIGVTEENAVQSTAYTEIEKIFAEMIRQIVEENRKPSDIASGVVLDCEKADNMPLNLCGKVSQLAGLLKSKLIIINSYMHDRTYTVLSSDETIRPRLFFGQKNNP